MLASGHTRGVIRARRLAPLAALAIALVVIAGVGILRAARNPTDANTHRPPWTCVTTSDLTVLSAWERLLHRPINCAVAFADAASDWQAWTNPWILSYRHNWPKYDWVDWIAAGHRRRHLVLTLSLIPSGIRDTNWLTAGADGAYEPYARQLAKRLIEAGMGDAVIRLGHEANGTWYPDSLPGTPAQDAQWARFWRNTALTMKAVPGAHFRFDWTVNAGVRPIPLASFYPGNRAVDVIGVDAYDSLPTPRSAANRLRTVLDEPDGLRAVRAFARRQHKPLSIPEWGIGPAAPAGSAGSAGDDPAYVEALTRVFRAGGVLYQGYFAGGVQGPELAHSPRSLAAYRRYLGLRSDAVR